MRWPHSVRVMALMVASMFACACSTDLTVRRLESGTVSKGLVYHLPRVVFDISLTRELTKCEPVTRTVIISEQLGSVEPKTRVIGLRYGSVDIWFKTTVVVTPQYLADPLQAYLIDYESLNGLLKKSDLHVELHDTGTLKSINVAIEDKTQEFIAHVVRGAASLAAMTIFPGGLVFPKSQVTTGVEITPLNLCPAEVTKALQLIPKLSSAIRTIERQLAEVDDRALRKELEQKMQLNQNALSDAKARLTHSQRYSLEPATAQTFTIDRLALDPSTAVEWFDQNSVQELSRGLSKNGLRTILKTDANKFSHWQKKEQLPFDEDFSANPPLKGKVDPGERYPAAVDVFASVVVLESGTSRSGSSGDTTQTAYNQPQDDLLYRQPVEGQLSLCRGRSCLSPIGKPEVPVDEMAFSDRFLIPQAGKLASLPLHNGFFDKNTLAARFNAAGTLVEFRYTTEAKAEKAAASFADSTSQIQNKRIEAITKDTEYIEAESKRQEALKKLRSINSP